MTASIRIDAGRFQSALRDMSDDLRAAAGLAVTETAAEMGADLKISIQQGPASGRLYKRGNVVHQASAPGETPASDTGTLMRSIYHERETDLTYAIGSRLVYAAYLEYGTSRMAPRPFFRPSAERIRTVFEAKVEAAIAGAVK